MIQGLSACPIFAYYINRLMPEQGAMARFLRQKSRNNRELRVTSNVFYLSR
jgi:hypothetical protein